MSKVHKVSESSTDSSKKPSIFARLGSKADSLIIQQEAELNELKLLNFLVAKKSLTRKITLQKMKKSRHSKKSKDKRKKSRGKTPDPTDPSAIESLELGDLEGADEKFLQKRRIQLQRELRLQLELERGKKVVKKKKKKKETSESSSSSDSSSTSSSSTSSTSSYSAKDVPSRKRKPSTSSEDSLPAKKKKVTPPPPPKVKVEVKREPFSPPKEKKQASKRPASPPRHQRRKSTPPRRKSPPRKISRPSPPKTKPREPSPKRLPVKKETRRSSPSRPSRARHSPPRSRQTLPAKSSPYSKEKRGSTSRRSSSRSREDREREILREKKRREEKAREAREAERRDREREAERREREREAERQKEREEALRRSREQERQRERERVERLEREKRAKEFERKEFRKHDKNELPSLLDLKTEAPPSKDVGRRAWEDRRARRSEEGFRRDEHEDRFPSRKGRKPTDFRRGTPPWEGKDDFRDHPPGNWSRDNKNRANEPWGGNGGDEPGWRGREQHFGPRRSPGWRPEEPPAEVSRVEKKYPDLERKPPEPAGPPPADASAELEDLSDISDDPDEILNQAEEPVIEVAIEPHSPLPPVLIQPGSDFFFDSRRPLLECLGDRGLDFEEISDEELEEEAKMGKGIMDVLGADWSSLMSQTPRKTPTVEVKSLAQRRWRTDALIASIGISRDLAGDEFTDSFLARIKERAEVEAREEAIKKENLAIDSVKSEIKEEILDSAMDEKNEANKEVKTNGVSHVEPEKIMEVKLLHPLAAVHSFFAAQSEPSVIQRLLNPLSKQALSARADLAIRRVMCGFSANEPVQMTACEGTKLAAA